MSDVSPLPSPELTVLFEQDGETLEFLANRIGAFAEAWDHAEEQGPPVLADFLPDQPEYHLLLLIELIKVDLECRWGLFDLPKRIREYVDEFPQLLGPVPPAELIYEEYAQRKLAGEAPEFDDCLREWPARERELRQLRACRSQTASPPAPPVTGNSLSLETLVPGSSLGDFDLLTALGRGAFARVFLARQRSMQRLVALKISLNRGTEGQTLAQLDHDYIVRVHDQHLLPDRQWRLLYMQYLPGGTLQGVVKRVPQTPLAERSGALLLRAVDEMLEARGEHRPAESAVRRHLESLSWPETVAWIGARLSEGLHYAHRRGILHRDIKPANVLLTAEGIPKLADFNISFHDEGTQANPTAYFGGSLAYMSPEHLEAFHPSLPRQPSDLDGRADIYSLGVLLWELLTGKRPCSDPEMGVRSMSGIESLLAQRQRGLDSDALSSLPPGTPESLRRTLLSCLEPDRQRRWETPGELATQLRICLDSRARELIHPRESRWSTLLRRHVVLIVMLMNVLPNALAALGNALYNRQTQVARIAVDNPQAMVTFDWLMAIINGIAFPVGIGGIVWLAQRVRQSVLRGRQQFPHRNTARECLLLGERCALICLLLWTLAGVAYPAAMHMTGVRIGWSGYVHFFYSLTICGLTVTAYPFFGTTWYAVRYAYPALLRGEIDRHVDREAVAALQRRLRWYLVMAATIPLLMIFGVLLASEMLRGLALGVCLGGAAAFGGAYWFEQQLEEDLAALNRLLELPRG